MKVALRVFAVMGAAAIAAPMLTATEPGTKHSPAPEAATATTSTLVTTAGAGQSDEPETGIATLQKAAKAKKYLFVLFRKTDDDRTIAMRKAVSAAVTRLADRAASVEVDVTSASEKDMVEKFHVDRAPMPLVLAIAPNGALTAGIPLRAETEELVKAVVSPATAKCLKALQDQKLVFVCIQNAQTALNDEAMQGVRDFEQDARFSGGTEVILLDPADAAESEFLTHLEVDSKTRQAITVFLTPSRGPIGTFQGATTLDELVATLAAALSGFG